MAVAMAAVAPDDDDPTSTRKYHDKEEFVTGHGGTSPHEIFTLCLVIPVGLHLYYNLHHRWYEHKSTRRRRRQQRDGDAKTTTTNDDAFHFLGGIVIEFFALMVPMLLVQTSLLPSYYNGMIGPAWLLLGMAALASSMPTPRSSDKNNARTETTTTPSHHQCTKPTNGQNNGIDDRRRCRRRRPAYLSIHRSCVYILTAIAILAVDFPIFPRGFCKTETAGYGWMDLGASSFVIIAGWSSALAAAASTTTTTGRRRSGETKKIYAYDATTTAGSVTAAASKAIKKCLPLLAIGFVRLATNKGLEYQEHVSEYGVHWNFFFTLSCVEGFMVLWKGLKKKCCCVLPGRYYDEGLPFLDDAVLALLLMIPYQAFLSVGGGQDFVENGDRRCSAEIYDAIIVLPGSLSFISNVPSLCNAFVANREGILGVVGYVSLRLLSESFARKCLLPSNEAAGRTNDDSLRHRRLLIMSAISWAGHVCLTMAFQIPNSRRSTNASFILWSLAHNISLLCLIHFVVTRNSLEGNEEGRVPQIIGAVNRFGLAVFLSSNVLTGLVNLTVDTLHSSDGKALLILSIYLAAVCGFALMLDDWFEKKKKE